MKGKISNMSLRMPLVFALYVIFVIFVSLFPSVEGISHWHTDKIGHFFAYMGMVIIAFLTFGKKIVRISALFGAIFLGAALEWGQSFVPGRTMSLIDGIVNTLGALSGVLLFRLFGQYLVDYLKSFIIKERTYT